MSNLYWKGSVSQAWGNHLNWWLDDAATIPAVNAPWVAGDAVYGAYDLYRSSGAANWPTIDVDIQSFPTGTCYISGIPWSSEESLMLTAIIYGGTFAGSGFRNNGTINGGTFTGDEFMNHVSPAGTINGGTFTGYGFTQVGVINGGLFTGDGAGAFVGQINGGTFTGYGFTNSAEIYDTFGTTFTGDGFSNRSGPIYGGTFSGSGGVNTDGGSIYGGTFTGENFYNTSFIYDGTFSGAGLNVANWIIVYGGTFIEPAAIATESDGITYLRPLNAPLAYAYPTPAPSGGGNDQMIARLLNLPWFINL